MIHTNLKIKMVEIVIHGLQMIYLVARRKIKRRKIQMERN